METRDVFIAAQNAANVAGTILAAEIAAGVAPAPWDDYYEAMRVQILKGTLDAAASAGVQQAQGVFPGAVVASLPEVPHVLQPQVVPVQPQPYAAPQVPQLPVPVPQAQYAAPPVPPSYPPQAPTTAVGPSGCPACGSRIYDNRADNARKRASGFKLSADLKCSNQSCTGGSNGRPWCTWPDDYRAHSAKPQEPR